MNWNDASIPARITKSILWAATGTRSFYARQQSASLWLRRLSVQCPSVRPFVRHTLESCQNGAS